MGNCALHPAILGCHHGCKRPAGVLGDRWSCLQLTNPLKSSKNPLPTQPDPPFLMNDVIFFLI